MNHYEKVEHQAKSLEKKLGGLLHQLYDLLISVEDMVNDIKVLEEQVCRSKIALQKDFSYRASEEV